MVIPVKLLKNLKKESHEVVFKKEEKNDPLDQILYKVPGTNTAITWADSLEGTLVTGSTGSGKSSGAGRHIGHAMLKSGYGMCILCVKKTRRKDG